MSDLDTRHVEKGSFSDTWNTASKRLPEVIRNVRGALGSGAARAAEPVEEKPTPAVPIKRSVRPDHIVCLEDGRTSKSPKRHLRTHHDSTPDAYRERWGSPHDYPMVAPSYAEARSQMARKIGSGRKPK